MNQAKNKVIPTLLKCLFIAVPIGMVLTNSKIPGMADNPIVVIGIVWLFCLGITWLINKPAKKSKLGDITAESASEKLCPYCAEEIKFAAVLCRYCRSNLDTPIQDKHVFAYILLAILIACFYVSEELDGVSGGRLRGVSYPSLEGIQ